MFQPIQGINKLTSGYLVAMSREGVRVDMDMGILRSLLATGVRGIDRIALVGKTMDFGLIMDGYDLVSRLTRVVAIR